MAKTGARISFGLVDVTAKQDSILTITDKQDFVNLDDLKEDDLVETKYGTCEKNQFALDGTFELMPDELQSMGLWSNSMSGEDGTFETPPVLNIDFTEPHSSMGLTFTFSKANDYCNHLNIKYYDADDNLILAQDFRPDNYFYVASSIIENYQRIVITFYSTNNPYRYLKLYSILYGADKIFDKDSLMSANLLEEVDLLSSELNINTLDFKVYSENDEFNIINPKRSI
jgi:hypothetical protein